ncbi:MAG: ABC transporter ATP-binding protein [Planctomycetota bacterium]|jgi:multiple sugar transport system ATP-binding protein
MAETVLEHVTKVFPPDVVAVDDVSLTVGDKEFVVLVGPSGCGKSTALRMVAGLEEPTSGKISIGGRDVSGVEPKDRDVAMVFQNYALYPHMDVASNLSFALRMRRTPRAEIRERVIRAADLLGLSELLDRKPAELSGGQRQRVAVGRAIVRDPAVFLFDEPLSNLDAKLRAETRIELKKLHRRLEATVIYVTHDQVEAMTLAETVVVMEGGRVHQAGPPLEVYEKPADRFVAGFLGSPPMNFIRGRLKSENGLRFLGQGLDLELPPEAAARFSGAAGSELDLGVRPERIAVGEGGGISLRGKVGVVEALGSEKLVYLGVGESELIAKVDARRRVAAGEELDFSVPAEFVHAFDAATGRSLAAES